MTRIAAVLLSLLLADPVHMRGAAPEVRRAEAAAPAVSIRAPAAGSLGLREKEILKKLDRMSTGQISELAEAYARMGNRRMVTVLSQALQKRDPNSTRSRQLISAMQDSLNNTPDDPLARTAEELMARNQPAAAAAAFRRLKAERYQGKVFPWQEDLAYACFESGQQVEARAAFEEILTTPGYPEAIRSEARKVVRHFMVEGIIKAGDAAISRKESSRAMQLADQLLAANPGDPDAVALKAGAYAAAGQSRRAIDWLLSMKGTAPGFFPHQMALAGAYQEAKMFADARTAYSVFLNEPAATDADQTEAKFRLQELEEEALLTSGDHALRTGQLTQAAGILTQLEKARPGSPAVANFRAAVQMKRREYGNARDTLIKLRDRSTTKREFFDGRDNLAEALAATGAPKEAMAEYGMVKDDPRFDTLTRYEAARRSSELQARYRPTLTQQLVNANEAEGTLVSAENEVSTGEIAGTPNVFLLRTAWDTVELDQSRLLRMKESERYQVEAVWRRHMRQGFYGEVSAGGSERGAVYGAALGRYTRPGTTAWELSFRGHDRALDSLPLIALDGRQNQIALSVQRDLTDRLSLDATVRYRWIDVRGHDLGQGLNVNLNASYTIMTETPTRPELTLSYIAELQRFARKNFGQDFGDHMVQTAFRGPASGNDLAGNLIEERINRHGVILTLSKKFSPRFSGYLYGGLAREFEFGANEGLLGGGLEAFVGPRTSLFLNVDYSTSGTTGGSRGAAVWSATTGAKISF